MRRPVIANARTAEIAGLALLATGFFVLFDAYDGHGRAKPRILGPFLPW